MMLIPLLVFGAVAIILVVLILRPGTAARSSRYAGDASMPMMWTDGNADASSDSSDTAIAAEVTRAVMEGEVGASNLAL